MLIFTVQLVFSVFQIAKESTMATHAHTFNINMYFITGHNLYISIIKAI